MLDELVEKSNKKAVKSDKKEYKDYEEDVNRIMNGGKE